MSRARFALKTNWKLRVAIARSAAAALLVISLRIPAAAQSSRDNEAAPEQVNIVLADFENATGEAIFYDTLKLVLQLALEQSPYVTVLPDSKVKAALQAQGSTNGKRITMEAARASCASVGAKAVVGGKISASNGSYLLQLTAVDCASGATFAEIDGSPATMQRVLPELSHESFALRSKLGEPAESVQKYSLPLESTTSSLEALRNYGLGLQLRREKGDTESIPFFKKAIELDSDFPLPYAALSAAYNNLRQPTAALEYAASAYRLRARANEREKLHLSGSYFLATGDVDQEIKTNEEWIADYPADFIPHNNLGNDFAQLGQLEKALSEYQQALRLSPSSTGYTNVMGMQLSLNRFTEAAATFDEAAARKLDGRYVHQTEYWLSFVRNDPVIMEKQMAWAAGKLGDEDAFLSMQSDTEAYYGRFAKARALTQQASDSAIRAGSKETAALWQVNAALRDAEIGMSELAQQEVASALQLSSGRDVKLIAAFTFARLGLDSRAAPLVSQLERDFAKDTLMQMYWLPVIRATFALNQHNPSEALRLLETAKPYELGGAGTFINYIYPACLRGEAFLMAGNSPAAIAEFQELLEHTGIVVNFVTGPLARLQIARARKMAGDTAGAKQAYEDFLNLWKDADAGIPVLQQAKRELAELH